MYSDFYLYWNRVFNSLLNDYKVEGSKPVSPTVSLLTFINSKPLCNALFKTSLFWKKNVGSNPKRAKQNHSGCGSVGRAVPCDSGGPQFESSHRQKLILNIYCQLFWKDKNKEKEARNGPFFKKPLKFQTSCETSLKTAPAACNELTFFQPKSLFQFKPFLQKIQRDK